MAATFQIKVFGKQGCDKCHTLNQRLDKLLATEEYSNFEKVYLDVETLDGLVAFAEAECINPSRIPAMLVTAWNEDAGEYVATVRCPDERAEKVGRPHRQLGSPRLNPAIAIAVEGIAVCQKLSVPDDAAVARWAEFRSLCARQWTTIAREAALCLACRGRAAWRGALKLLIEQHAAIG